MSKKNQVSPSSIGTKFQDKLHLAFSGHAMTKHLAKGEFLIREGETEHHVYLIESGAVRAFYLTEFEEIVIRLGYRGSIITSLTSFINGTPSELFIDAIRKTTVKVLPREALMRVVNESTENLKEYTALLEALLTQQMEREIDLLTHSPAERLRRVLRRSPNLFQEIPLKYIASYLRMTPETLSRIRNS